MQQKDTAMTTFAIDPHSGPSAEDGNLLEESENTLGRVADEGMVLCNCTGANPRAAVWMSVTRVQI